jgi:hypothetical protein
MMANQAVLLIHNFLSEPRIRMNSDSIGIRIVKGQKNGHRIRKKEEISRAPFRGVEASPKARSKRKFSNRI